MPGICRDNDTAEGDLIPSQSTVYANAELVIVNGDDVEPHAPGGVHGPPPPTMIAVSNNVFVGGIAVCNQGDLATCDHPATGSGDVFVGNAADAVAIAIGATNFSRPEAEALEILEGRQAEEDAGLDPDSAEGTEYGDGGVGSSDNRYNNTSPINNVSGPQDANSVTDVPSPQPSNENGEYIRWLDHVDSRVNPQVVAGLEQISQEVGYQLQVTSGYRSPEYNARVGGARNSQHVQGNATDIVQTGLTAEQRQAFISAAIDAGFTAIGVYPTFTHVDVRGGALRAWGDTGSWRSLPRFPWALEILQAKGYNYPGG